jgi:uncharacterized membrane protein YbhN (UPF0104 family)
MARAFFLSVLIQVLGVFTVYVLARGLGQDFPLGPLFAFFPIVVVLSAVPISIAGIGVREASMVLLLGTLGVEPAAATALSLAWFLSVTVGTFLGLYEYFRQKDWRTSREGL